MLFRFLRIDRHLREAQRLAAEARDEEALAAVDRAFCMVGADSATALAPPVMNLFYASLLERLDQLARAYSACTRALDQLEVSDRKSWRCRTDADRQYLRFHCKWMLARLTRYVDSEAFVRAASIKVDASTLRLDQVNSRLRGLLPLNLESATKFDEFMRLNEQAAQD